MSSIGKEAQPGSQAVWRYRLSEYAQVVPTLEKDPDMLLLVTMLMLLGDCAVISRGRSGGESMERGKWHPYGHTTVDLYELTGTMADRTKRGDYD